MTPPRRITDTWYIRTTYNDWSANTRVKDNHRPDIHRASDLAHFMYIRPEFVADEFIGVTHIPWYLMIFEPPALREPIL